MAEDTQGQLSVMSSIIIGGSLLISFVFWALGEQHWSVIVFGAGLLPSGLKDAVTMHYGAFSIKASAGLVFIFLGYFDPFSWLS